MCDATPVIFIHGLWLHSASWGPWAERFHEAGYEPFAPGWPGEHSTVAAARQNPETVAGHGIESLVEHFAASIGTLKKLPVIVGHSFGGLIAQRLLGQGLAAAAVAIDAAPIKGVLYTPPSALRVAAIVLRNPANRKGAVSLSREQFRYAFANAVPRNESDELFERWAVPSPGQPLFESAAANLLPRSPASVATGNAERGPLLLVAGGMDRTVPWTITMSTLKQYRISPATTDFKEVPDRGHSLVVDSGWSEIADHTLGWLAKVGA